MSKDLTTQRTVRQSPELIRLKFDQGFRAFGFGRDYVWAKTLKKARKKAIKLGLIKKNGNPI